MAWGWLAAAGISPADEPKPPPKPTLPPGTPAEQVQALIRQYEAASGEFRKRFQAAKSDEEQHKVLVLFPDPDAYAALLVEIAEKHPRTRPRLMHCCGPCGTAADRPCAPTRRLPRPR